MPGGSVTKIGRTYKKWAYIAKKIPDAVNGVLKNNHTLSEK
jgi:hypothetical protein